LISTTRLLAAAILAGAALANAAERAPQDYPRRPIRFIVPYPPGGSNDIVARLVGPKLGQRLGQPIVVDNRPGAAGNIGLELAVAAKPDGYTMLVGNTSSNVIIPALYGSTLKIDPVRDLTGVSLLAAIPQLIVGGRGGAAGLRGARRQPATGARDAQ
jgi:tripartite-type tricarboxylate transporter receptor subunit TctC